MIEIYPNLFIGMVEDYEVQAKGKLGWLTVHACKEPYHRQALGYRSNGAPKGNPEYLIARRKNRLILNLVDVPNPAYISKDIIDAALEFIHAGMRNSCKVLVHCNLGESRSPSIGVLYLSVYTDKLPREFLPAEKKFREIYPLYNPSAGMRGFLIKNWDTCLKDKA